MFNATRPGRPRLEAGAGPLIGLRVFLGPHIWRIAPAWAMLAGALTSGAAPLAGTAPLRLLGAAILADSLWGMLWRLTAGGEGALSAVPVMARHVPYYHAQSPAGRTLRLIRYMIADAGWHELVVALGSAAVLSLLLGWPALALTALAWAITLWAWLLTQARSRPAGCDALLNVGLPWLLGWALMGNPESLLSAPAGWSGPILGAAFVLMQWGAQRVYLTGGRRMAAAWLGQLSVVVALIGLQQAAALVPAVLLLLPSWWLLRRAGQGEIEMRTALAQSGPWWLAAMLLSAYMLR
ncbi:MAG: hypothetical protein ACP5UQ_08290 [Anaerolineae bacterium]